MRRSPALLCAAVVLLSGCAGGQEEHRAALGNTGIARRVNVRETFIAVSHDCPEGAVAALQGLCDDAAAQSGGALKAALQYWEDPMQSGADMVFVTTDALAGSNAAFTPLDEAFLFSNRLGMDDALNAPAVLSAITEALPGGGYEALAAYYCGREFLLTAQGGTAEVLRGEDSDEIRALVAELYDGLGAGESPVVPAVFGEGPVEDGLYSAGTQALLALYEAQRAPYALLDMGYRFRFGILWAKTGLRERLGAARFAALCEASAGAKPACVDFFAGQDAQAVAAFDDVIVPPARLRRSIRDNRGSLEPPDPMHELRLYRVLEDYAA